MGLVDALVPTLLTTLAVGISTFDAFFIRAKVHGELPDTLLVRDSQEKQALLHEGAALAEQPNLSLIQKEHVLELCAELKASGGLSHDQREHIVQMCAGAALFVGFIANLVVALATAVFAVLAVSSTYRVVTSTLIAVLVVLVVSQMLHMATRVRLSEIEEYHLAIPGFGAGDGQGPTWGTLLRLELIVFNGLLFVELALAG